MKKTFKTLLIIFLLTFIVSCSNEGDVLDNLVFEDVIVDEEVVAYKIIGYNKNLPKNLRLPESFATNEHGKKPVTIIASGAFNSSNIKSILIPETYELIEEGAFFDSVKLERVTFDGQSNLKKIEDNAFKLNRSLKKIVIPKSVISIGEFAFAENVSLESVIFEEGSKLETIGSNAFRDTKKLKEITLPPKLNKIGDIPFYGSTILSKINVEESNAYFISVDGVLYSKDKTKLIIYPSGKKDESYFLLEEILEINSYAFYENKYLRSLVLNNNLKIINEFSFARITNLKTLIVPIGVEEIKEDAFRGSTDLTLFFEHNLNDNGFNINDLTVYYKPNWNYDSNNNPVPVN